MRVVIAVTLCCLLPLGVASAADAVQEKSDQSGLSATNWTVPVWVIREADEPLGSKVPKEVIRKAAGNNEFRLVAHPNEQDVVYYTVKPEKQDGMTPFWKTCKLFPRGLAQPEVWRHAPLPKTRARWQKQPVPGSNHLREPRLWDIAKTQDVNSRRLEGDLIIDGQAGAVTLWIVENAIYDDTKKEKKQEKEADAQKKTRPLLVIDLRMDRRDASNESGTGTGDPR